VLRVSLILGVCVHLLGFLFFRVRSEPLPERTKRETFVQFVSPTRLESIDALDEQVELMDTAPLFIPGQWNAAHTLSAPARDMALQRFPPYQPEIDVLAQLRPERSAIAESPEVTTPADLLALRYWDLFRGFGEGAVNLPKFAPAGAFAEVRDVAGRLRQTILAPLNLPSAGQADPVIFLFRVEAGGRRISPPTPETSSGNADFDAAASVWLRDSHELADLSAGLYRIRVYP
jgi:hypothetical protein